MNNNLFKLKKNWWHNTQMILFLGAGINFDKEKNSFGREFNSRVFKYDIDNIHQLHCDNLDKVIYMSEIHSTKEFWRKAINVKKYA